MNDKNYYKEGDSRDVKILLAEDNPMNQKLAELILRQLGYQVDIVNDGREALAALKMTRYDIILMDIQMPEVDGLEATRMIRDPKSDVCNHEVPIIAMTALVMEEESEQFFDAGMNDYVSKPFDPGKLDKIIKKYIALQGHQRKISDDE
ncbi:MAG: response regulator [Deltaproteobacteria bacterium]|nr:MAG: response regulator [Deltaproteobacteria bacterium]